MNAGDDEEILARIEAAANSMPDVPVSWDRVKSLARRKALISAAAALIMALVAAVLLTIGGSAGSYGIHGVAPIAIPFAGVSVPDVRGMSEPAALSKLKRAGLEGAVDTRCRAERTCIVGGSHPAAGSNVVNGAKVKLALQPPRPVQPKPHGPPVSVPPVPTPKKPINGRHKIIPPLPPSPPSVKPAKIALLLTRPRIEADGKSTTTIEATVLDAEGKQLQGQHVAFTASDPADRIATRFSGALSVATVTSSETLELVTIQARDGAIVAQISFTQTRGSEEPMPDCGGAGRSGQGGKTTQNQSSTPCSPQTTPTETTTPTTPVPANRASTGTTTSTNAPSSATTTGESRE